VNFFFDFEKHDSDRSPCARIEVLEFGVAHLFQFIPRSESKRASFEKKKKKKRLNAVVKRNAIKPFVRVNFA
jgi:hypothetical protein